MSNFNYDKWFRDRGLEIRDYQRKILRTLLSDLLASEEPLVLAAAPGAGKTDMSIALLEDFCTRFPKSRVLVLAHGTRVLRTQYYDRVVERRASFSCDLIEEGSQLASSSAQVIVSLPQTIYRQSDLPQFDLLVVDEAHEYYLPEKGVREAGMVPEMVRQTKPKYQLLMTGSPSKFIALKYPLRSVTLHEIVKQGAAQFPLIELSTSPYHPRHEDYTDNGFISPTYRFLEKDTVVTLEKVVETLGQRLHSPLRTKPGEWWARPADRFLPPRELGKTMWVCNSQEQASQVQQLLEKRGIGTALSTSDTDADSKEIENFRREADRRVLVVVRRGILGFDMPELENIVDMSLMKDVDTLFQLLCRLTRLHPRVRNKFFLKVVPTGHDLSTRALMAAAISLSTNPWFTEYNRRNLRDLRLPTKVPATREKVSGEGRSETRGRKKMAPPEIPEFNLEIYDLFHDIYSKPKGAVNGYAYTTLREVEELEREELEGRRPRLSLIERLKKPARSRAFYKKRK